MSINLSQDIEARFDQSTEQGRLERAALITQLPFKPGDKVYLALAGAQAIMRSDYDKYNAIASCLRGFENIVHGVHVKAEGVFLGIDLMCIGDPTKFHLPAQHFRDARDIFFARGIFVEACEELWFLEWASEDDRDGLKDVKPYKVSREKVVGTFAKTEPDYVFDIPDFANLQGSFGFIKNENKTISIHKITSCRRALAGRALAATAFVEDSLNAAVNAPTI